MSPERVELVLDAKARLGAGAVWDAGPRLLHSGAREGPALALGRTFAALDLETRKVSVIAEPEAEKPRHGNRFNDGKCDPRGRFWAGTMYISEGPGAGGLDRPHARPPARAQRPLPACPGWRKAGRSPPASCGARTRPSCTTSTPPPARWRSSTTTTPR